MKMNNDRRSLLAVTVVTVCLSVFLVTAQAQSLKEQETGGPASTGGVRPAFHWSLMPNASSLTSAGGSSLPVSGSGTLGRLTKWTGFTGSSSIIGDTTIFEDKFGSVGIGTDSPTSRLTVAGLIQTTLGGLKFPDGTIQTTATVIGLQTISHDSTLQGDGTDGSPLGAAIPLLLQGASPTGDSLLTVVNTGLHGHGLE